MKGNRIMMEKQEIVAKRHTFLQEIRQRSDSGRPIVYLDKTCLHCKTLVDEFRKTGRLQEETVEQLLIEVNGDDDG